MFYDAADNVYLGQAAHSPERAYMESHGGPDVTLANGTEPFTGPLLPLP